ncbi:MAG: mevalonate kinase [Burkholderiaceae bacterium]|nr:MAG: mevalonate kinase [Burkholderiaceae bacterium]
MDTHELVANTARDKPEHAAEWSVGHGKIILLGEHSVVYGRHAVAAPLPFAIRALASDGANGIALSIPGWGVERRIPARAPQQQPAQDVVARLLRLITERLGLTGQDLRIRVDAGIPRGMGVGGSAALAVAIIRALGRHRGLQLSDEQVCALAFECEKIAHGTPSGIDNTVATYGHALLYRAGTPPEIERIVLDRPPPLVLGLCHHPGLTVETVAKVRRAWTEQCALHERVFDAMDAIALAGLNALRGHDWKRLGALMNMCQGQLESLGVSSDELDDMIRIARRHGAVGAKLTGGGGGGAMIALCPDGREPVIEALSGAGYDALEIRLR